MTTGAGAAAPTLLAVVAVGWLAAACAGIAQPSVGPSVGPSVAASGVATRSPTPEPTPSPTPAPTVNTDEVLQQFEAFVTTQSAFHLFADMRIEVAGILLDIDLDADYAAGDQQGTLTIIGPGSAIRTEIVLVDGVGYVRLQGGEWIQSETETETATNPLEGLALDGLVSFGRASVGGQRLNHFQVNQPAAIDTSRVTSGLLTDVVVERALFDFYLTDDGVPVTATLSFGGTASFGGIPGPLDAEVRYEFSAFGEPVEIVAPI